MSDDLRRTKSGDSKELSSITNVREPRLYAVILHNDDYTTMDFVVSVLMRVFQKTPESAAEIMMLVHQTGQGVAGVFPYDLAVTKKLLAERMAEDKNFPLKITVSEAIK